jgi:BirA family biotin operon repressor/biotin-[acetyl-CoA-carboxylase] ligase
LRSSSAAEPASVVTGTYDGVTSAELARTLDVPNVLLYAEIGSTLDAAHQSAADGALAGTLVLADAQTAGRGRMGRSWTSQRGSGVWLTLIERPRDIAALEVLSIRVGLAIAPALDPFASERVRLKWPNDIYVGARKLAGILVEARWRDAKPEWVSIGVGINVRRPENEANACGLNEGVSRLGVVRAILPALRAAALQTGCLTSAELEAFAVRDLARGRECVEPVSGVVQGIDATGGLLVDVASQLAAVRTGSLVLKEES